MEHFQGTDLLNVWTAAKRAELTWPLAASKASAGTSSNDHFPRRGERGRRQTGLANWIGRFATESSEPDRPGWQRVYSKEWSSQLYSRSFSFHFLFPQNTHLFLCCSSRPQQRCAAPPVEGHQRLSLKAIYSMITAMYDVLRAAAVAAE